MERTAIFLPSQSPPSRVCRALMYIYLYLHTYSKDKVSLPQVYRALLKIIRVFEERPAGASTNQRSVCEKVRRWVKEVCFRVIRGRICRVGGRVCEIGGIGIDYGMCVRGWWSSGTGRVSWGGVSAGTEWRRGFWGWDVVCASTVVCGYLFVGVCQYDDTHTRTLHITTLTHR